MSSKLSIKDGFEKDKARYRSHDRYKEEIVAATEDVIHAKFKDMLRAALAEQHQQPGLIMFNPLQEVGQQQMVVMASSNWTSEFGMCTE